MANWIIGSAICTLAAVLLVSSTIASSEGPFIVAHKKASLTRLKSGSERVSVSIDVYNQGSATAYDVTLNDDSWSQEIFDVVAGNTSVSWERLDAGALLSHSFELEAKTKTVFYSPPAVITFRIPTKAALQEAYSTPILPLDVLADRPPEKKFDWRLLAKYGSLVSVISIVVLFVYLVASPTSNAAKGSKKKR
ncbi:hypothetical protein BUALT_Bualt04G0178700 [Buddleja alternifolia]|uniref:Translocon-associated protein subunit beta n=1 Tax=Buddleja alternifolia TaxID=168488 RepID=A0AAV6Y0Q4_9LAMI|nr:hypothetical protein BUALT_Bualt04G0178700 [Buddleja alternifolia]